MSRAGVAARWQPSEPRRPGRSDQGRAASMQVGSAPHRQRGAAPGPLRARKRGAGRGSAPHGNPERRPGRSDQRCAQLGASRQRGVASGSLRARRRGAGRGSALECVTERADEPTKLWAAPDDAQAAGLKWRHSPAPGSSSSISTSSGSSVRQGSMRSKTISWIVQSMSMISVTLT